MTLSRSRPVSLLRLFPLAFLLAPYGCSHEVDSPKVTLDQLEPELVCNAQIPEGGLVVEVQGDGFTPLPVKVIEEPASSELPTIDLNRVSALDGGDAPELAVKFSGKKSGDNGDKVGWASKESMSITLDESNVPEQGLYGVTVTNPDGKSKDELEVGLAVVDPPRIDELVPAALCNRFQDQTLTVVGDNFISVGGEAGGDGGAGSGGEMPSITLTPTGGGEGQTFEVVEMSDCYTVEGLSVRVEICKRATAAIPAESLEAGDYTVSIGNSEQGGSCISTEDPTITVLDEGPILFNVDPNVAYDGLDTRVNLYVTALDAGFSVTMFPDGDRGSAIELESNPLAGKSNVIQATIPAGTAPSPGGGPGYTVEVTDEVTGCQTSLDDAVRVTNTLVVENGTVTPPFGLDSESNAITIALASDPEATGTPRAFLNPGGSEPAIQLRSVTVLDATTLTAVVPSSTPARTYDLVIVWPDGSVAVLSDAYTSQGAAPPVIDNVNPQSVEAAADQIITLTGTGFTDSSVTLDCLLADGSRIDINASAQAPTCDAGACTQIATLDASPAGQGAACVVRVTNADGSYGDFSAVATTNASLNLSVSPTAGPDLNTARRALVSAGVRASSAARFIYAVGGDDGAVAGAMSSVEFAGVDLFGAASAWTNAVESMATARAFAGSTTIGRYIYVVGGNDGSGSLASAERALVLSPDEIPEITNLDLCLSGGSSDCFDVPDLGDGLGAGVYSYRIAAVIDPSDPVNLGGETLASDPIILRLRDIDGRRISVKLDWTAPLDSEGTELSGITGYRIYRTPVDGVPGTDEVLLDTVDAATLTYIDDDSGSLGSAAPVPLGSTSAWQALPDLGTAREGLGVTAAMDPATAGTWHLYALLGQTDGTAQSSYEFLTITEAANGRQTVESASWVAGNEAAVEARYNAGVWRLDDSVSGVTAGTSYVYLGAGDTGAGRTGTVEVATVTAGGQLSAFDDPGVTDLSGNGIRAGYGSVAVGSADTAKLFIFGGETNTVQAGAYGGQTPTSSVAFPDVAWNGEGAGADMSTPRIYLGTTIQSANVFFIGGSSNGNNALASTERVVW